MIGAGGALTACVSTTAPGAPAQEGDAAAQDVTTVTWWNPDVSWGQPTYEALAKGAMEQNPEIGVEIQVVPEDGFQEKISAMIAGGTGPDVWVWFYATDTARHGFLEEITPYLEADGIVAEELWFPICLARSTYEDRIYSVPRDGVWAAVGYNQTLFEEKGVPLPEEGWTLEDYLEAAKALTDEEQGTFGTQISGPGALCWDIGFCWNMGFELVSLDGRQVRGLLDSPASIEAIQWMLDLEVVHKVAPSASQSQTLGDFAFGSGKIGMTAATGWGLDNLKALEFEWGLVPEPIKPGGESYSWGDSVQYYMWSGSQQKDAAWALMKFISSPEGGKIAAESGGWTPPTPVTWVELGWDQDPILGTFWQQAQKPSQLPNYLRTEYHWECVQPNYEGIWTRYIENGERPLDALVVEAATLAQECLDEAYANA
jgi:multiple sugar transport system substrate-binding protein